MKKLLILMVLVGSLFGSCTTDLDHTLEYSKRAKGFVDLGMMMDAKIAANQALRYTVRAEASCSGNKVLGNALTSIKGWLVDIKAK